MRRLLQIHQAEGFFKMGGKERFNIEPTQELVQINESVLVEVDRLGYLADVRSGQGPFRVLAKNLN